MSKPKSESNIKSLSNRIFGSKLFPFVMAAVMLLCYYASLDLVAIYLVVIAGILIFVFCDDLTPVITLFVFMNVIVSYKHSPSFTAGESNYYLQPHILIQVAILIGILVVAGVFRLAKTIYTRKFKPSPILYGLCALAAAFLLNGVFSSNYTPMNLVYGLIQAVIYLGVFALLKDNIKLDKDTFEKLALNFLALSVVLLIELGVTFLTAEIYIDGEIVRDNISFGWGVYNTMGLLLLLCVPAIFYLAGKYKRGWLLTVYSVLIGVACVFTTSRQAMVGLLIVYPISYICMLIWTRKRREHIIVAIIFAAVGLILTALLWNFVTTSVKQILANMFVDGEFYASSRSYIYDMGFKNFERAPIFGVGFYSPELGEVLNNVSGLDAMPDFYHNTLLQMAASCGLIGFIVYVVHRCQTVLSFLNNITPERTFIALSILVILILSLFDVHMFDILPTFLYSCFLAVLVASEKKKPEKSRRQFIIKV